jgi:hypothetical protein
MSDLTNGLVVMTPTSIAYSGTSASINADGSVDFSACSTLELRGIFTALYDNYLLVMRSVGSVTDMGMNAQYLSGTTPATGSNYATQNFYADGGSLVGGRLTSQTAIRVIQTSSTLRSGAKCYFFGPYLSQPTGSRVCNISGYNSALLQDTAHTHSLSTSYDGLKFTTSSGNATGLVTVFGYNQ